MIFYDEDITNAHDNRELNFILFFILYFSVHFCIFLTFLFSYLTSKRVLKSTLNKRRKNKAYQGCVLSVLSYGSEPPLRSKEFWVSHGRATTWTKTLRNNWAKLVCTPFSALTAMAFDNSIENGTGALHTSCMESASDSRATGVLCHRDAQKH